MRNTLRKSHRKFRRFHQPKKSSTSSTLATIITKTILKNGRWPNLPQTLLKSFRQCSSTIRNKGGEYMKFTNTKEDGLESLIVKSLIEEAGYQAGDPHDYVREYAVDLVKLSAFLRETQPEIADKLSLEVDTPTRTKFLHRLQGEIAKHGIIEVLRKGVNH